LFASANFICCLNIYKSCYEKNIKYSNGIVAGNEFFCRLQKSNSGDGPYTKIEYTGTTTFSEVRYSLSAAAAGNKVVFAGGYNGTTFSKTVDVFTLSK
jgi:hypothetical protein